jgi:hypothetical protein
VAVVRIGDDALEDGIEGDAFADHVMRMVSKAAANQLTKTLLMGVKDAGTPVKFIQSWDGWAYIAANEGHVVDASTYDDRYIDFNKMDALLKAIPNKYLDNGLNPTFLMSRHVGHDYRRLFSNRETGLGDAALISVKPPSYAGLPVDVYNQITVTQGVPVSPAVATTIDGTEAAGQTTVSVDDATGLSVGDSIVIDRGGSTEEVRTITAISTNDLTVAALTYAHVTSDTVEKCTADGSFVLLTEYGNLVWGIQRDIRIETDRLPRLRATDWVLSFKMDAQVYNPDSMGILNFLKVRP